MSESQLREIPYTVVQTNHAKQLKIKHLQWSKGDGAQNEKRSDRPPPPYSPQGSEGGKTRLIRGSGSKCQSPGNSDSAMKTPSSIASSSSTHSNSNSGLPRMLDQLGIADNYSYGSQRSNKSGQVGCSALYGNPNTLLVGLSNGYHDSVDLPRVNHEHTDLGLGGEQDCAYSSKRSSDSIKQGTKGSSDSRMGLIPQQSVPSPRISSNYNLGGIDHKSSDRNSFIRSASKNCNSNTSYNNSRLSTPEHNAFLRGSLRSVASSPITNGNEGPLRLQYRMGSSVRSKSSVASDLDDNHMYSCNRADANQNNNQLSQVATSVSDSSKSQQPSNGDLSEMSTEL